MTILNSKKVTFTYDNVEVDWYFGNTFNLYFIDEIGERDYKEADCFSGQNVKTIEQAEEISNNFVNEYYN